MNRRDFLPPDGDIRYSEVACVAQYPEKRSLAVPDERSIEEPLDFSTRHRQSGAAADAVLPCNAPERKMSQDSGINECLPSAIDFRPRKQHRPQHLPSQHGTALPAELFATDSYSRTPSPLCASEAVGEQQRVTEAMAHAAASGGAAPAVFPGLSPFVTTGFQNAAAATAAAAAAAAAAAVRMGNPPGILPPAIWQMALNPAAAAMLMQGDTKAGQQPTVTSLRGAACKQSPNGNMARSAKPRSGDRSSSPAAANGYYALPGTALAPAAVGTAFDGSAMAMQAIRNQSEELFNIYKQQLLESQDKQRRVVREAAARNGCAPASRLAGATPDPATAGRRRQCAPTAGSGDEPNEQVELKHEPQEAGGGVRHGTGCERPETGCAAVPATASSSLVKDACSSTCSRSPLSSDGSEGQGVCPATVTTTPTSTTDAGVGVRVGSGGGVGEPPAPSPGSRKRSRGSAAHDEQKDGAYWERRRKNNEAAKRSRDARRAKEDEIAIRAAFLEQENLRLRVDIASLKQEAEKLRCLLYSGT